MLCTVPNGGIRTFYSIVQPGRGFCPAVPASFADVAGASARSISSRIDRILRLNDAFQAEFRSADGRSHLDIIEFEVHNNRGHLGRVSNKVDRVLRELRNLDRPDGREALLAEHGETQREIGTVLGLLRGIAPGEDHDDLLAEHRETQGELATVLRLIRNLAEPEGHDELLAGQRDMLGDLQTLVGLNREQQAALLRTLGATRTQVTGVLDALNALNLGRRLDRLLDTVSTQTVNIANHDTNAGIRQGRLTAKMDTAVESILAALEAGEGHDALLSGQSDIAGDLEALAGLGREQQAALLGQHGATQTQIAAVLAALTELNIAGRFDAVLAQGAEILDDTGILRNRSWTRHNQVIEEFGVIRGDVAEAVTTVLAELEASAGVDVSGVIEAIDRVRTVLNGDTSQTTLTDILAVLRTVVAETGSADETLTDIEALLVAVRDIFGILRQSKAVFDDIRASGAASEVQLGAIVEGIDGGNTVLAGILDRLLGLNGAGAECPLTHEYTPALGEAASACVQRCPAPLVFEANARFIDTTFIACASPDAGGLCRNPRYASASPWFDVAVSEHPYSQGSTRQGLGCYSLVQSARGEGPLTVADFETYDEADVPASYPDLDALDNPIPELTQRIVLPSGTTEGWLGTAQACPDPTRAFGIAADSVTYPFFARFLTDYWCAYLPVLGNILFAVSLIFSSVYFFRSA